MRHKPEEHDEVMARRRCNKLNRRGDNQKAKPAEEKEKQEKSQQRKLILTKEMKAALLTVGAFTEEQAEAIVNETQVNLPKDF